MKKKGFTLIELLAVIVILAIIALIATPIILNVIEKAKKGAAESSALGYIDAVEKQIAINTLDSTKTDIADDSYTTDDLKTYGVTVKGEGPEDNSNSWVLIEKGRVKDYSLKIGDYIVNYDSTLKTAKVTTLTAPSQQPAGSVVKSGATKVQAQPGETHKGIIYLDPTDLTTVCDDTNSVSTTGTKSGCMKWYVFDDSGSTYKMILDHNTTSNIAYNGSNDNSTPDATFTNKLNTDTAGWQTYEGTVPRLITAEEVAEITGAKTSLKWSKDKTYKSLPTDIETQLSEFYFDGSGSAYSGWRSRVATSKGASNYAWLFDNTTDCESYGCNNNDTANSNNRGYWTSTACAGSSYCVWYVQSLGCLRSSYSVFGNSGAGATDCGVRPVITISKKSVS